MERGAPPIQPLVARAIAPPPGPSMLPVGGPPSPEASQANLAFGLAIGSWLCCGPFTSVPALYLAHVERRAIRLGRRPAQNLARANSAYWLSITNLVVSAIFTAITGATMFALG